MKDLLAEYLSVYVFLYADDAMLLADNINDLQQIWTVCCHEENGTEN